MTIVYDGDGNRVAKTVNGVTTRYLVDDNNHTGYAQVVEELQGGVVTRQYTYGHDLISQRQQIGFSTVTSFYGYDGHGSVRYLTDAGGAVTDRYDYDAFGALITQVGTTPNLYLYAGEQWDPDLGLYFNRARYLNVGTGRFHTMDIYEGESLTPSSMHKYLYAGGDPINKIDPAGLSFIDLKGAFITTGIIISQMTLRIAPYLTAGGILARNADIGIRGLFFCTSFGNNGFCKSWKLCYCI